MEVILAAIRPKQNVSGHDYKPKLYEILLLEYRDKSTEKQVTKYLPSLSLSADEEPRDEVLNLLYKLTGAEYGGIKGERALLIEWTHKEGYRDSLSRFALFCIPISSRDKLNSSFVDKSPDSPKFFGLDTLLHWLNNSGMNFPPPTRTFVDHVEHWLKMKHTRPGALDILFRSRTEYRIRITVNNPAFLSNNVGMGMDKSIIRSAIPDQLRHTANETLAKMIQIEKCDKVVINPLFGSGLILRSRQLQPLALNTDYPPVSRSSSRKSSINSAFDPDTYHADKYPLHVFASNGDVRNLEQMLARGYNHSTKDGRNWTPLHCAARYSQSEAVQILLTAGASPNVLSLDDKTPLHLAAENGWYEVLERLLEHPETDVNAVDKKGRTALDMCQHPDQSWRYDKVKKLLIRASKQPRQIEVQVMDGTKKMLNLVAGANTTVQQLNQQMLRQYQMPETPYADIFTIWICSQSLELQLKPGHRPLEHMSNWQGRIVTMLTDGDPKKEEPHLTWRRNAKISLLEEREVVHPDAIKLLFYEARQNYIKALYPCKEQDVTLLASILLFLNLGEYDHSKTKTFLSNREKIPALVPAPMLRVRHNWSQRITSEYKEFSNKMKERPDFRFPTEQTLQLQFLNNCRNLTVYGSAFFTGQLQHANSKWVTSLIGVNDVGLHIINAETRLMNHSYKYSEISWRLPPTEYWVLEVKVIRLDNRQSDRHVSRNPLLIKTRQAGMINHLMEKLSRIIVQGLVTSRQGHLH